MDYQISSVQSLNCVRLFATLWSAVHQADVGNLISGSSAFSKTSLNIRKFTVHILLKPGLENFEHYFISVWDECNCVVVWAFFGIAFLWDWNENWGAMEYSVQFSSVTQSCLTLRPHESQHTRPPCPSPTPGVHSDSHPSSQKTTKLCHLQQRGWT